MLKTFFATPIEISIGEKVLKFHSLGDFDFCLSGRTAVPSNKITEMVQWSTDELKKESKKIKGIEKHFVEILSRSIEDLDSINSAIRELDPLIFSHDHDWRTIIMSLHDGDEVFNKFRRIALVKYMQYLSSRQEIIKYLYSEKKKYRENKAPPDQNNIASALAPENDAENNNRLERMPKGEVITIDIKNKEQIGLLLSKHECRLTGGEPITFTDETGSKYMLNKGQNTIGRDKVSDIIIDASFRDISRLHLIIDIDMDNHINLTDLSSHGSYIAAKYLQYYT